MHGHMYILNSWLTHALQTLAQDLIEVDLMGDPEEVQRAVQESWADLTGKRALFGCKAKVDFSVT